MPAVTMLTVLLLLADMAVGSTSIPLKELWRSLTETVRTKVSATSS